MKIRCSTRPGSTAANQPGRELMPLTRNEIFVATANAALAAILARHPVKNYTPPT